MAKKQSNDQGFEKINFRTIPTYDGINFPNSIAEMSQTVSGIGKLLSRKNIFHPELNSGSVYSNLFNPEELKLSREINEHKAEISKLQRELEKVNNDNDQRLELQKKFQEQIEELRSKQQVQHIITRIHPKAEELCLSAGNKFINNFTSGRKCQAVVLSIDIRRSTELMLRARTPIDFSNFITELTDKLEDVIKRNFGVFDKFTGDGILAFFPDFYSGKDSLLRAIKAANESHEVFKKHYSNSRHCFDVFNVNVGLGIGVDFGDVTIVNSSKELTVVGKPVVYACRMSGADAGETLLNQRAFEQLHLQAKNMFTFEETEINIKHEGNALAYKVKISKIDLDEPEWFNKEIPIEVDESTACGSTEEE